MAALLSPRLTPVLAAQLPPHVRAREGGRRRRVTEEIGRRHGLQPASGFLLGETEPGVADVVTTTLWSTMAERLPKLGAMLEAAAPMTAALTRRVAELPPLAALAAKAREDYGDAYCGGQIEVSLRKVLNA